MLADDAIAAIVVADSALTAIGIAFAVAALTPLAYFLGKGLVAMLKFAGRRIGSGIVEAVEAHVQPRFDEMRDTIVAQVRDDLAQHTSDEGNVVRLVVQEELGNAIKPVLARLDALDGGGN